MRVSTLCALVLGMLSSLSLPAQEPAPGREPGLRFLLEDHDSTAEGLCWSADGKILAAAAASGPDAATMVIKLRDAQSGKTLVDVGKHHPSILGLAMTRDGKTVVAGGGGWRPISVKFPNKQPPETRFEPIFDLKVWDVGTGKLLANLEGHKTVVMSVCLSPDDTLCASSDYQGTVKLWNMATGKEQASWQAHQNTAQSRVIFSPDGKRLATASGPSMKLWDTTTLKEVATYLEDGHISSLAFNPDGAVLASAVTTFVKDPKGETPKVGRSEVILRDAKTGKERLRLQGQKGKRLTCLAFSPDGKMVAGGHMKGGVLIWDDSTGKELVSLHGHIRPEYGVGAVVFSPDSKLLAASGTDKIVRVWEVAKALKKDEKR